MSVGIDDPPDNVLEKSYLPRRDLNSTPSLAVAADGVDGHAKQLCHLLRRHGPPKFLLHFVFSHWRYFGDTLPQAGDLYNYSRLLCSSLCIPSFCLQHPLERFFCKMPRSGPREVEKIY
jgi:hypothetical protein